MHTQVRIKLLRSSLLPFAALFFLTPLAAIVVHAQGTQNPPAANPPAATSAPLPVIKTESRIVLVDAVVTDKKGNYLHDLTQQEFKVYEDNKEQAITSFSSGSDPANPSNGGQRRYVVLFFDNSSMATPDQITAREAAGKFVEQNAAEDRVMAVAEYGGSLVIKQNFTANVAMLKSAVSGVQTPYLETNGQSASQSSLVASNAPIVLGSNLGNAEADLGARSMLLSIRTMAKNLRTVPGRKMLILFTAGFPLDIERMSELTATIDACNKANVAVYPLDVRGLVAPIPTGKPNSLNSTPGTVTQYAQLHSNAQPARPRLVLASYPGASTFADPQKPGGGGGGTGGGHPSGGGGAPTGGSGGGGGKPGGGTPAPGGGKGGTTGTTGGGSPVNPGSYYNNPANQPRTIVPPMPTMVADNQQILLALAQGTGGFAIYNTNDLLGGLNRIGREQNEFYILGYVPQASTEGACHTLKVKVNRGGTEVRSRSGYCDTRPADPLEGKPVEKQMEVQAASTQPGSIQGAMQVPYFYSAPNIARVNVALDLPGDSLVFNKEKGKYHSNVNVLGIAYRADGTIGARFSDTLDLDLEKDEMKEFAKQPYHYQNQFDAAPGTYKLTIVFSAGSDHFGKFETPLKIDPYDGKKITLGGVVLSNNLQRVDQISSQMDANLVEDRTPLIIQGLQVTPAASYQFKKSDNVVLYSELYAPVLKTEKPPQIGAGYTIYDKATNKQVFTTGPVSLDNYIQKGNAVVPFGMKLPVKDLAPGTYRLVLEGMDAANNRAPSKNAEFTITN
jgi:VWFA-related protein